MIEINDSHSHLWDGVVKIALTKGKTALIDAVDGDLIGFAWQAYNERSPHNKTDHWYARRGQYDGGRDSTHHILSMHRTILERILGRPLVESETADHVNGNGLDNRRHNLRLATRSQNNMNMRPRSTPTTSRYKGVHRFKRDGNWQAQISYQGHRVHLGYFDKEKAAARAYDVAAKKLFDNFCYLNFPDRG